jgi:outer membrane scaffolding protein for murein synthesis (MipA/OmpV family)
MAAKPSGSMEPGVPRRLPSSARHAATRAWLGLAFAAATGFLLSAAPAQAQSLPDEELVQTSVFSLNSWNFNIGGGVGIGPDYQGSDHYKVHPVTIGSLSYRNVLFVGPAGAGANFFHVEGLRAGPVLGYRGGRKETVDVHLKGMGNISASIEAGVFLDYDLGPFTLSGTYRHALTHSNNGAIGRVQLDFEQKLFNDELDVHVGPEVDFGDSRYVTKWFGVTPAQAAASGFRVYTPHGGANGAGVYLTADYYFTPWLFLHSFGSIRELIGDAGNSPIVMKKEQAVAGMGLVFHWDGGAGVPDFF